jgi:dTDP-4-amino-4,6-dideoxygalactose transaminase
VSLFSPIHHTFGPLADREQRHAALRLFFAPGRWRRGEGTEQLRRALEERFSADAFLFASGREGLVALLRALTLQRGEEIIGQGYTCVVLPNAIVAAGGAPVYADIERETLNMDPQDAERRITSKTRAIVCQHTFGIPSNTRALRALCDRYSLRFIEDCAHVIPDETGPESIGRDGEFLMLSFGRDKAISGVTGGAILSRDPTISAILRRRESEAADLSAFAVARYLLYPLLYGIARPLYGIWIGKALLAIARALHLLPAIVSREEKRGGGPGTLHRLPNACAELALLQLRRLREFNDHRRRLNAVYRSEGVKRGWFTAEDIACIAPDLPLQKFPMFARDAQGIRKTLKRRNIHLNDGWTSCVVCPPGVQIDAARYEWGMDPEAEAACEQILSLPTHPAMTIAQAQELMATLDPLLHAGT